MTVSTDATSAPATREKSAWWRAVLGEYPTGVCLVTSKDAAGEPIGMVVGSLVAVSEEPPLLGLFVDTASQTLPRLLSAGRFCVSVLSARQEGLCRSFAQKRPDRWEAMSAVDSPAGFPRPDDALVWFDVSVQSTDTHGDHMFVVGHVDRFGSGSGAAEMPLLFRRAGYGSFVGPSETYDARAFAQRLRWVSEAGRDVQALADDIGAEVAVNTQLGDAVITLASATPHDSTNASDIVGASHPWAAPIAPVFAAWAPAQRRHAWEEASRHLTGAVDRALIEQQLRGVRERGYAIAGDLGLTEQFLRLTRGEQVDRDAYARMWEAIAMSRRRLETDDGVTWGEVAVVQVPVFDVDGSVVMSLYAIGLQDLHDGHSFDAVVERIRATADRLADLIAEKRAATPASRWLVATGFGE